MPCRLLKVQSADDPAALEFFRTLAGRHDPGDAVEAQTRAILADVAARGDEAVIELTRHFDCPIFAAPLAVSQQELERAASTIAPDELDVIAEAAAHIREFHQAEKERSWFMTRPDGTVLGQKVEAVERAGLYVPGGQGGNTPLISSLLMGAVPAQVAGVREIAVVSPPREDGSLNPYILAAAYLLDITEVYRVGGPWAIAALAQARRASPPWTSSPGRETSLSPQPRNLYRARWASTCSPGRAKFWCWPTTARRPNGSRRTCFPRRNTTSWPRPSA